MLLLNHWYSACWYFKNNTVLNYQQSIFYNKIKQTMYTRLPFQTIIQQLTASGVYSHFQTGPTFRESQVRLIYINYFRREKKDFYSQHVFSQALCSHFDNTATIVSIMNWSRTPREKTSGLVIFFFFCSRAHWVYGDRTIFYIRSHGWCGQYNANCVYFL